MTSSQITHVKKEPHSMKFRLKNVYVKTVKREKTKERFRHSGKASLLIDGKPGVRGLTSDNDPSSSILDTFGP